MAYPKSNNLEGQCNKLNYQLQIALTFLSSLFERFLGDVLYTQILNEAKIPFLFKDLICQPELIKLWQKVPNTINKQTDFDLDPLTLSLILLFGGPNYLNIRNLLWHGFVIPSSSTEIQRENINDPFPIYHYFVMTWTIFTVVVNRIKNSLEHQKGNEPSQLPPLPNRSFSNTIANDQFEFIFGKFYKCLKKITSF